MTAVSLWLVAARRPLQGSRARDRARPLGRADSRSRCPSYLLVQYLRALRWRYLTDPIRPLPTGPLFRAVSVGFMANNIFPLRMGEVVRAWYLARETGVSAAAVFGTVILERVIDTLMVVVLALGVVMRGHARATTGFSRPTRCCCSRSRCCPSRRSGLLRFAPELLPAARRGFVPAAASRSAICGTSLLDWLRRFQEGLGALRGGVHLLWILLYSLAIWLVASTLPMIAGFLALGIEFPSWLGGDRRGLGDARRDRGGGGRAVDAGLRRALPPGCQDRPPALSAWRRRRRWPAAP